ncbi:unnamed protein product, partial [Mesorhabditis belari]|uniref:Trehalase n=1 Tax=Mesorhabditis belari TaxID=2138241 RepID=A0AAF3EWJ3_9BILA
MVKWSTSIFLSLLFLCAVSITAKSIETPRDQREITEENSQNRVVSYEKTTISNRVDPPQPPTSSDPINYTQPDEGAHYVCNEKSAPGRENIYCKGKLLEAVMAKSLYSDSKTFVDRPIKQNKTGPSVYTDFLARFPEDIHEIDPIQLRTFVDENFDKEGQELNECFLDDWSPEPQGLIGIADTTLRKFAFELNKIWKELCRVVDEKVKDEPERYSLLYVPNRFIAPGGRFREFYYWDAYWIIRGLLASNMYETSKAMILNFKHIVDEIGFVPNGGRVYYLQRSQPPLFAAMVYEHYAATLDLALVKEVLPSIEKELAFWKNNRSAEVNIEGKSYDMLQYRTPSNVPRPESFREDVAIASQFHELSRKRQFWQDIASAAESGWDFSSRWFADSQNLSSIETTNIIPVDLNAFYCYNLNILGYLHGELGNITSELHWMQEYIEFRDKFRRVFYVPGSKGWYDYNLRTREHNLHFYPSMAVPLFTGCYDRLATRDANQLYDQMSDMGAFNFVGGIPTSLERTSNQQWDFPNGWSPLNHMVIEGLRKSGNPRMQRKAFDLAEKWVLSNYRVFVADRAMWEKYNVASGAPRGGGGGEYEVQAGFGWTNGVILDLLSTYGDRMHFDELLFNNPRSKDKSPTTFTVFSDDAYTSSKPSYQFLLSILSLICYKLF